MALKWGEVEVATAKEELPFLLNKKDQTEVVRAMLKRIFTEAANMAVELFAELQMLQI